jgi:hypothetical protein
VDLVGEEYSKADPSVSFAKRIIDAEYPTTNWKNADLSKDERSKIPDKNPTGIGPLQDLDFQIAKGTGLGGTCLCGNETIRTYDLRFGQHV